MNAVWMCAVRSSQISFKQDERYDLMWLTIHQLAGTMENARVWLLLASCRHLVAPNDDVIAHSRCSGSGLNLAALDFRVPVGDDHNPVAPPPHLCHQLLCESGNKVMPDCAPRRHPTSCLRVETRLCTVQGALAHTYAPAIRFSMRDGAEETMPHAQNQLTERSCVQNE